MKKFVYSLEAVLNYKTRELDEVQQEYAAHLERVEAKKRDIERLREKERELNRAFDELKHRGASIERFQMYAKMIDQMDRDITYQCDLLAQLEDAADAVKERLIAANIDVGKFEKLKAKQYEAYRLEAQKEEEAFIEEFVQNAAFSGQ